MTEFETQAIVLLRSIDASMKALVAAANRRAGTEVASDSDLDSQYGDETIRFLPRDWSGDDLKGQTMSRCPPDFLDEFARSMDYFAKKNEGKVTDKGKPKSDFDRRSAARARGWAKRLRSGWKPREAPPAAKRDFDSAADDADDFADSGFDPASEDF